MNSKQTEVRKIGDGRIIYDGETYVNEKSSRVIPTSEFIKQSLPSKPVGDVDKEKTVDEIKNLIQKVTGVSWVNAEKASYHLYEYFKSGYAAAPQKEMEGWIDASIRLPELDDEEAMELDGDFSFRKYVARFEENVISGFDRAGLYTAKELREIKHDGYWEWLDESPSPSEAGDGWIRVEDGLPEVDTPVYVRTEYKSSGNPMVDFFTAYMDEYGDTIICPHDESYGWQFNDCVTHWHPCIPAPPIQKTVK